MPTTASQAPECVILGGGGHAKILIDTLRLSGAAIPCAVLDSDRSRWGQELLGVPILGDDSLLPELTGQGVKWFAVGVGSTGDNRPRQRLFEVGLSHNLSPLTIIHPTAARSKWAEVGPGAQLLPLCIVNAGAKLGANVIVNNGVIVDHDCSLGDHVHVANGAHLSATVRIGKRAHIGTGATVRQGITIGEGAIVGAGAVVVKDVPDNVVVVGVPAKILRSVE